VQKQKIDYSELTTGYEFPQTSFRVDTSMIVSYLTAIDDTTSFYQDTNLVPPMALVALAMAELSKSISLPEGAIHVSQELEFLNTVSPKDLITSHAKVSRKQKSGRFHLLTIDLHLRSQNNVEVLFGQTEFILPFLNDTDGK
jgi:hypothetical protein